MALAVSLPALGQDAADTRPYVAKNHAGLSLRLDLRPPEVPGRNIAQPLAEASESNMTGFNVTAEQSSALAWPYFLLGLLVLGGSAAWYLRRQHSPVPIPVVIPPVHSQPDRHKPSPNPFGIEEESQNTEADKAKIVSPTEQFDVSVQMLKSHIEQNPGDSPVPWLLLLDLLHRKGNAKEYEQTRRECKKHFNVNTPAYKKIEAVPNRQGIESYPHIMNKLIRLWPGDEASTYLNALLHDSRDGSRVGFDLATYHDIALLRSLLESVPVPQAP